MSGKGSRRRPEDSDAIARNWPLGRAKLRDVVDAIPECECVGSHVPGAVGCPASAVDADWGVCYRCGRKVCNDSTCVRDSYDP